MTHSTEKPEVLAIIPARGGSKGIPRKNLRLLGGKPLVAYSIETARGSELIDRTVVSTEDLEIASVAREHGADVVIRPVELAQDDTPSLPVLQHVISYLAAAEDRHPRLIVLLQPTSPLRAISDVDNSIRLFLEGGCDSVVSVCEVEHPLEWMYTLQGGRLEPVVTGDRNVNRRQDAAKVYRLNGAVYVTSRDIIMEHNRILGNDTRAYVMPPDRSIDIDTEIDLKLAEFLINERA